MKLIYIIIKLLEKYTEISAIHLDELMQKLILQLQR